MTRSQPELSNDKSITGIEFLKPQQDIVDNKRIGRSGEFILHYLKDVFETASIVDINVNDAFFALQKERELKVSVTFTSLEASGIFKPTKLRWEMMQGATHFVEKAIRNTVLRLFT